MNVIADAIAFKHELVPLSAPNFNDPIGESPFGHFSSGCRKKTQHRKVKMREQKGRKAPLYKSFGYAFEGIFNTVRKERNMQIHCLAAGLVVLFGILLHISVQEWMICLVLFGMVMGLECVNTAVEAVVDLVTQERKPLAKKAKDAAAGAVLIAAIMAAVIGCGIFLPKILGAIM